jgi:hypothetical protein
MSPFDEGQVRKYAQHWFALDTSTSRTEQKELSDSFMAESGEASDLRANPLVLSLLCALYSSQHFIPPNRPEIYHRCAELLFEQWDRSRGIETPQQIRPFLRSAVQRLAWRLFTDRKGRQALPRSEIRQYLATEVFASRFSSEEEATQAADDFLSFCAGRAWVLTDTGSDKLQPLYGFVHKTFLEFFAAAQLVKQQPEPRAVWAKLEPHVMNSGWEMVCQLATQILDQDHEDGADKVLTLMLDDVDACDVTRNLGRPASLLNFGARCLQAVVPNNATLGRLANRSVKIASLVPTVARRAIRTDLLPDATVIIDEPVCTLLAISAPANWLRIARYGSRVS